MKCLMIPGIVLLSGCSVLKAIEPNSIAPEFEHVSHLTQHEPLTNHPTNYGANIANVTAEWDVGKHIYVTLAEGLDLDRKYQYTNSCGEIIGPREQFTGRIGYKFILKESK